MTPLERNTIVSLTDFSLTIHSIDVWDDATETWERDWTRTPPHPDGHEQGGR